MVRPLGEVFKQAGDAAARQWSSNARATSGQHGKWYPASIDAESKFTLGGNIEVEVGPNAAKKQGGMGRGFEFGSRQPAPAPRRRPRVRGDRAPGGHDGRRGDHPPDAMKAVNDAAVSRLEDAGVVRVFSAGEVPSSPGLPYAVVSTDAGTPNNYRLSAQHGARRWRVNVQCIGRTYDECARTAERADDAFLDQPLTEVDEAASPCVRDLGTVPERDPDAGGVLYALMSYTFTVGSN
jgi:hypothetical protein